MKIRWHMPYKMDGEGRYPEPLWPENWPLPSVGNVIQLNGEGPLWVRAVDFFPSGEEADDREPFIYIVLSNKPC